MLLTLEAFLRDVGKMAAKGKLKDQSGWDQIMFTVQDQREKDQEKKIAKMIQDNRRKSCYRVPVNLLEKESEEESDDEPVRGGPGAYERGFAVDETEKWFRINLQKES